MMRYSAKEFFNIVDLFIIISQWKGVDWLVVMSSFPLITNQ